MEDDGQILILLWLISWMLMIASVIDMIVHNINMMNCMIFVIGMLFFLIILDDIIMICRKNRSV